MPDTTPASPENWVFLGDSLTEGIGSRRVSYVSELAEHLCRQLHRPVHYLRFRAVEPASFNAFIPFNIGAHWHADPEADSSGPALWLWNLASESTTAANDLAWLPLLKNLRPTRTFVFRGAFESILRPAHAVAGEWPRWLPPAWRSPAAMDPRCYFSSGIHRRLKQSAVDHFKQFARRRLLADPARRPVPLVGIDQTLGHIDTLVSHLSSLNSRVSLAALLPVSHHHFPGSAAPFDRLNQALARLSAAHHATFVDWTRCLALSNGLPNPALFFRDGFHPNARGARTLANHLLENCIHESHHRTSHGDRHRLAAS